MSHDICLKRPKPEDVNESLARVLQGVAARGWARALPHRGETEIAHQFNTKPSHIIEVTRVYKSFASVGGLVIASSIEKNNEDEIIGFALARNDISGNIMERVTKGLFARSKIFAWLRHVAVDEAFQGQQVGTRLVNEAMRGFRPDQIPTAYIFEENELALGFFSHLGFEKTPSDQQPQIITDYFGEGMEAVAQYRFAAPSVSSVIQKAQ